MYDLIDCIIVQETAADVKDERFYEVLTDIFLITLFGRLETFVVSVSFARARCARYSVHWILAVTAEYPAGKEIILNRRAVPMLAAFSYFLNLVKQFITDDTRNAARDTYVIVNIDPFIHFIAKHC